MLVGTVLNDLLMYFQHFLMDNNNKKYKYIYRFYTLSQPFFAYFIVAEDIHEAIKNEGYLSKSKQL